jgi:hypothetical protein
MEYLSDVIIGDYQPVAATAITLKIFCEKWALERGQINHELQRTPGY